MDEKTTNKTEENVKTSVASLYAQLLKRREIEKAEKEEKKRKQKEEEQAEKEAKYTNEDGTKMSKKEKQSLMISIEAEMKEAAKNLDFERAMELRDALFELKGE